MTGQPMGRGRTPEPGREADRLLPVVYDELRSIAARMLRARGIRTPTLQPTALVHEAYMRLADRGDTCWVDESHFKAVAATAMRQILADSARRWSRRNRRAERVTLEDAELVEDGADVDLVALDTALRRLGALHDRQGRIVELRMLAGLSAEEVARVLDVSAETVRRDWRMARAWLLRELSMNGVEP